MPKVKLFWNPDGIELDTLGTSKFLGASDGDTPTIAMHIRMLSIDTPETHYPGNRKPSAADENLSRLAEWMKAGQAPLRPDLSAFLYPKLATGRAGTLQEEQGEKAADFFKGLLNSKLIQADGAMRKMYLRVADQPFDQYGRLLAYIAPTYTKKELLDLSLKERATFNLLLVESGWAATFPIYPSLPKYDDMLLLRDAAETAYETKRGVWADELMLTGYEFRMCIKLFEITKKLVKGEHLSDKERSAWISRYCVDMTTRELVFPEDYHKVKPYNRVFVWPQDIGEAVARLNLVLE